MREYILERAKRCGEYIVKTGCTVRICAAHFCISKSTVHKDVTDRLMEIDVTLYKKVQKILDVNLKERHLRGGNATKIKYENLQCKKNMKVRKKECEN